MARKEKVIYYKDEQNDDFANTKIKRKALGKGFRYIHKNIFFRIFETVLYYIPAAPLVYLMQKFYSHQKFINRKALKKVKDTGYFIYSNHTQILNDAYIGPMAAFPKKCFIITGPDATSIKGIRTIVQALGAIPLPGNIRESKEMLDCIDKRIEDKNVIMIYPEAHIWPYYTGIRKFPDASFKYPTRKNVPMFVLTNCYQKRRFSKKPKILTFVDGPFYPNKELSPTEAAKGLCEIAYNTMCRRACEHSTYEYIRYVKEEEKADSHKFSA